MKAAKNNKFCFIACGFCEGKYLTKVQKWDKYYKWCEVLKKVKKWKSVPQKELLFEAEQPSIKIMKAICWLWHSLQQYLNKQQITIPLKTWQVAEPKLEIDHFVIHFAFPQSD